MKDSKEKKEKQSTAPKRSEAQKESDRTFIAGELVKCTPLRAIAGLLNERNLKEGREYTLHYMQVYYDTKRIFADWKEQKNDFIDTKIELELAKLARIETECWKAWDASKEGKRRTLIVGGEVMGNATTPGTIAEREHETTFGDTKFLDIIQKCMDRRAALLGLNAPTRAITANLNGISGNTKEEIEAEIAKIWKKKTY